MRGDIAAVADQSFDCLMCGLCAARCPVGEAQYNIAILCRRLYGKYLAPRSKHLEERIAEIKDGKFDAAIAELKTASLDELKRRYNERDIEPE
jgi:ferredoxin